MPETNVFASITQRNLNGTEKAAVLLLAVGQEMASRVITHFGEDEIRAIARSATGLGSIPQSTLDAVADEFIARAATSGGLRASPRQLEELLEKILPPQLVRQIMSDVHSKLNEAVWPRLAELPAQVLAQFLKKEHPQIIAYVLSKVTASLAAEVVALFPSHLRNEAVRRMLTNKLVLQHSLRLLEQGLREELLLKVARTSGQDTHARIAKIINKLDRRDMDEVLDSLGASRPKAAEIVRSLLFTFEDIAKLPEKTRTVLFENIEPERLIPALSGATPALKDLILSSVPSRTRRVIEQDLAAAAPLGAKEGERARREVADIALQLAEQGTISLTPEDSEE